MKLWIMSDLHAEYMKTLWRPAKTPMHDVLVAAGDIAGSPASAVKYLRALTDRPIVYVLGNHEFYGKSWHGVLDLAREAATSVENFHFLENDVVTIGGVRFLGCTLWTDFAVNGTPSWDARIVRRCLTDYQEIRVHGEGMLTPAHVLGRHHNSASWLKSALAISFDGPTVVVTHHAPHKNSIHPRFQGDGVTAGFVSHLPELVERTPLWVHGHVHDPFDYMAEDCRVICNPLGYRGEHDGFNETLVIETTSSSFKTLSPESRTI